MTTDRSYRVAMAVPVALDELRDKAGSQFDPAVVEALVEVIEDLETERPSMAPARASLPAVGTNGGEPSWGRAAAAV